MPTFDNTFACIDQWNGRNLPFLENCSIDNFDGVGDTDCNVVVISTQAVVAPKKKKKILQSFWYIKSMPAARTLFLKAMHTEMHDDVGRPKKMGVFFKRVSWIKKT